MPLSGLRKVLNINPPGAVSIILSDFRLHGIRAHAQMNDRKNLLFRGKGALSVGCTRQQPRADEQQKASAARAFFSRFARGASAKTVWGSMQAEQVSIAQRWRRPCSDPEYRKRGSDIGKISEKCSS